jgi:hypothetical protein
MPTKIKSSAAAPMAPATSTSIEFETLPDEVVFKVTPEETADVVGPLVVVEDSKTVTVADELITVDEPLSVLLSVLDGIGGVVSEIGDGEGLVIRASAVIATAIVVGAVEHPKSELPTSVHVYSIQKGLSLASHTTAELQISGIHRAAAVES